MFDAILAALGLSKSATIGGFLGAVVSLKLVEGLNLWQRATTVFGGALCAAYVTPLLLELITLSAKLEAAVAFLTGVFGMSFVAAISKAIPEIVQGLKDKIAGGGK